MSAAAEPSGHLICSDVLSGHSADDPLYQPILTRVRETLGKTGLLYVGDSKMAALETRGDIVFHGDYYLVLFLTGDIGTQMEAWVTAVVDGNQAAELIWDGEHLLCVFSRRQSALFSGQKVEWPERVLVVRSLFG
jgi:hypothetical protein